MKILYCLDANVLIQPWNNYYSPKLCPNFLDILSKLIDEGIIFCTSEVEREILKEDDALKDWIQSHPKFVHEIDEDIQIKLRKILAEYPYLVNATKDRSMGDPWVIAHAWSVGATVVTSEIKSNSVKRVKIPDVCEHFKVRCIDVFDFFKEVGISFDAKVNIKK
jgi:hypothetical protein